jgi:hypothetical protein
MDVLTREGVEFIDENGGGAGVRLRRPVGSSENEIADPASALARIRAR